MIKVNGKSFETENLSVEEYLLKAGYDTNRIAVELNGSILPKSQYKETLLCDGDFVEVVSFVGGG